MSSPPTTPSFHIHFPHQQPFQNCLLSPLHELFPHLFYSSPIISLIPLPSLPLPPFNSSSCLNYLHSPQTSHSLFPQTGSPFFLFPPPLKSTSHFLSTTHWDIPYNFLIPQLTYSSVSELLPLHLNSAFLPRLLHVTQFLSDLSLFVTFLHSILILP